MAEMSPTYVMFHAWLKKNRKTVAAKKDKSVIYSGMDKGGVPIWKRLHAHEETIKVIWGKSPAWEPIVLVLKHLKVNWKSYKGDLDIPAKVFGLGNLWDFADQVEKLGAVTKNEEKQIWINLSAWYVKNATGDLYVFDGDKLDDFPVMLLAEIPVLLKNKDIKRTEEIEKKMVRLIPASAKAWASHRDNLKKEAEKRK